jgi:hypothetical protein
VKPARRTIAVNVLIEFRYTVLAECERELRNRAGAGMKGC